MKSRQERRKGGLAFEALEGRVALSGVGGLGNAARPHRGVREAVEVRHHGADDAARVRATTANRAGAQTARRADDHLPRHSGLDEVAGHDAADDNLPRRGGRDDARGHR